MGFARGKRERLVSWFGEAFVSNLERRLKALSEKLKREGVEYKAFAIGFKELSDCLDCGSKAFLHEALARVPTTKAKASGDPIAQGILEDLRSLGRRQPSQAVVTAAKALRAQGGVGPYLGDLAEGRVIRG
jgi:hypothetical protein